MSSLRRVHVSELSAVPCSDLRLGRFPTDRSNVIAAAERLGAKFFRGSVKGSSNGLFVLTSSLPRDTQRFIAMQRCGIRDTRADAADTVLNTSNDDEFGCATACQKAEAERRLRMMLRLQSLLSGEGMLVTAAYALIAREFGVSIPTVKRAWKTVRTVDEGLWLDLLVKGYKGRTANEIDARTWTAFLNDYGRVEQPQLQATWERVDRLARRNGWGDVPSAKTFKRRWDALPAAERVLMRDGEKALGQLFPYVERDRSGMKPNDGFNIDGRTWDVFVQMPDGRVIRPTVSMVQDEATNYLLSWIVGESESGDMYRRVLCETFSKFGIPSRVLFDNTRAAANKMLTAGAKKRNRFKDKITDIEGILPRIGCEPHFALPENGRSKLVERAFCDIKERSEKDPRLAGAYSGRSPSEKPANYGKRAVSLDLFKAVLAEAVEEYNARVDRRGKVAFKTSHRALYEAGVKAIKVRRLTKAQKRLLFMVAETRTLTPDGVVHLGKRPHVNRYWSQSLQEYRGQKVVVRYDPDNLLSPVLVETLEGRLIEGSVPILEKTGFKATSEENEFLRLRTGFKRRTKQNVAALKRMEEIEHSGDVLVPETSEAPIAPVIAPDFKRKTPAQKPTAPRSIDADAIGKAMAMLQTARFG